MSGLTRVSSKIRLKNESRHIHSSFTRCSQFLSERGRASVGENLLNRALQRTAILRPTKVSTETKLQENPQSRQPRLHGGQTNGVIPWADFDLCRKRCNGLLLLPCMAASIPKEEGRFEDWTINLARPKKTPSCS